MTHTPGPWTVHPTGAQVTGGPDGMTSVANTFETHWRHSAQRTSDACFRGQFLAMAEEHRANARLIAAAPDMLAALIELKNCAASLDNRHHAHTPITAADWSDMHQAINAARATIAKAQGNG